MVDQPTYHKGTLTWYGCSLSEIADRYDTPLHLGATEAVEDSIQAFKQELQAGGIKPSIYYSVKTNPLPKFLNKTEKEGCGFEVVNHHEAWLLKKLQVPPEKIIMTGISALSHTSGLVFTPEEYRMITVSTMSQLKSLEVIHSQLLKKIKVAITITPKLWQSYWDITLNSSRINGPVGVAPGSSQFEELLTYIAGSPALKLEGFHMHLGSAISSTKPYRKGIEALERAALKAKDAGMQVRCLDIGGGFKLSTAPMLKVRNIVTSILGITASYSQDPENSIQLQVIGGYLSDVVRRLANQGVIIEEVAVEPGRVLSGPCQLMILTVQEVIHRDERHKYLVCDSGAMSLSPMFLTEKHRITPLVQGGQTDQLVNYEVLGPLPTGLDRLSSNVILREIKAGERIAVLDTGAYILPLNNTFSGPLPAVAWIENSESILVRQQETLQQMFSRDLILEDKTAAQKK